MDSSPRKAAMWKEWKLWKRYYRKDHWKDFAVCQHLSKKRICLILFVCFKKQFGKNRGLFVTTRAGASRDRASCHFWTSWWNLPENMENSTKCRNAVRTADPMASDGIVTLCVTLYRFVTLTSPWSGLPHASFRPGTWEAAPLGALGHSNQSNHFDIFDKLAFVQKCDVFKFQQCAADMRASGTLCSWEHVRFCIWCLVAVQGQITERFVSKNMGLNLLKQRSNEWVQYFMSQAWTNTKCTLDPSALQFCNCQLSCCFYSKRAKHIWTFVSAPVIESGHLMSLSMNCWVYKL